MIDAPLSASVQQLHSLLQQPNPPVVLDVREAWERDIVALPGSVNISLATLADHSDELPKDRHIAVICHHGGRSARATGWLRQNGFTATNIEGGIDAWAEQVEPALARY